MDCTTPADYPLWTSQPRWTYQPLWTTHTLCNTLWLTCKTRRLGSTQSMTRVQHSIVLAVLHSRTARKVMNSKTMGASGTLSCVRTVHVTVTPSYRYCS